MKSFLFLITALCFALCAAKDLRIKGARPAKINDYPAIASVSTNGRFFTQGIILSKRIIMTPAFNLSCDEIEVRVGSASWAHGGEVVTVEKIVNEQFLSFLYLENEMTFGRSVKAARFTEGDSSVEFTKLQLVGWGYPSEEEDEPTDVLYVQNLPVLNQDECEDQYEEVFDQLSTYVPFYCVSETSNYGMFDYAAVPVYRNGAIEAFAIGRDDDTTSILLVEADFLSLDIKMTMNMAQ